MYVFHIRASARPLDDDGGWVAPAPTAAVAGPPVDLITLEDEDWGTAAVDIQLLLEEDLTTLEPAAAALDHWEDWMVVPWVPPSPPEVTMLPGGVSVTQFVERTTELHESGLNVSQTVDAAALHWVIPDREDTPLLRLAAQLVAASRQVAAFNMLEVMQERLLLGDEPVSMLMAVIKRLVLTAAQR